MNELPTHWIFDEEAERRDFFERMRRESVKRQKARDLAAASAKPPSSPKRAQVMAPPPGSSAA